MGGRESFAQLFPWEGEKSWKGDGLDFRHDGGSGERASYDGSTPLHASSWREKQGYATPSMGTVEGTRLLIKHGAIIDAEDNEGMTPLQLALEHGRDEISTCLMEHGAIPIDFRTDI
jgi:hypothetical protein